MRGEHGLTCEVLGKVYGSAPRARGTRDPAAPGHARGRISPACAGNTSPSTCTARRLPDQPRVRGEHIYAVYRLVRMIGSAPRARGTRIDLTILQGRKRISPACAGEHLRTAVLSLSGHGSAPRARGTHPVAHDGLEQDRISPACAGNTIPRGRGNPRGPDQPRVRGEHPDSSRSAATVGGSAPRARGTLHYVAVGVSQDRISPACAGNTRRTCPRHGRVTDQPRVRGEHLAL